MTSTSKFSTDQVFMSREDLMAWVQNVARSLGFVIVTKRSKTRPSGYVSKVVLMCDRGGISRSKIDSKKDIGTMKTDCPFELVAKYSKMNDFWTLRVVRDEHNHEPATYIEGHAYAMRFSNNEYRLVADLTRLNVKPRDILSTLKEQNENNVSSLRTVYNARRKYRMSEQQGRTPIQNLMYILQDKGYRFEFRTNDGTNELEELFFAHPTSMEMWRAFPHVVLMDATYNTNKYNLPFLEIVGVTSTNKTFSIAFVFMHKEKTSNYTWALTCLKMTMDESFSPRVIVTDRDLALMKACENIFPDSKNLLCRWHISNDITKHCRQRIKSHQTWSRLLPRWNSLVESPTETIYKQNYAYLQALLVEHIDVLDYLHRVWLDKYAEMFVSLWTDKYLNFGNSTTNRVESQHAKLKKYLDTAKCDLDRFVYIIEDIVQSQHTAIKESFERSRIFRWREFNVPLFQDLQGSVSKYAMKKISDELDRAKGFPLTQEFCGCQLRTCFGLPCAHELVMYISVGMSIPLHSIDIFWRKLDFVSSMPVKDRNVDCKMFEKSSPHQSESSKFSFLRKLKEVVEPVVKKNNRGRPKIKRDHLSNHVPHRHSCVNTTNFWDFNEQPARHSSYDMDVNKEQWERSSYTIDLNKEPSGQSSPQINLNEEPVGNLLLKQIPSMFHYYVKDIRDVRGDGNYGFRAIAACLGFGEDHWLYIRQQLLDELLTSYNAYAKVFTDGLNEMHTSLCFWDSPAPPQHWMVMPETSILIANRFGVTVNFLSNGECSTCFPLWKSPEEFQSHPIITIAHVNGNHYVMVILEGDHTMPPILRYWVRHKATSAVTWETLYMRRLENYRQLNPRYSEKDFVDLSYFM